MFIKKSFVDEIANSMHRQLVDGAINKQAEQQTKLVKAADYLNAAAEIFDEAGMTAHAEVMTSVLESLAKKKDKNKAKDKKGKKPAKKSTKKTPTSEKMVKSLKEKGWVFDESDSNDKHYIDDNCAMCGDMSYAHDSTPQWWRLYNDESGGFHDFKADRAAAERSKQRRNEYVYPGWELDGPFKSLEDIEKKYNPEWFDVDTDVMNAEDNDELYSMLDEFKTQSEDMDFEDELDFDDFEDRVRIRDPFENYNKIDLGEDDVRVHDPFEDYEKTYL